MADLAALPTPGDPGLVWQRVKTYLGGATPEAQASFKALKEVMVSQRKNPPLVVRAFSASELITADDGLGLGIGTARIYGIYLKKQNDVTDSWFTVVDEGTDANIYGGALTASYVISVASRLENKESVLIFPAGFDILVGIRLASFTAGAAGTTASAAAGDVVNGFIIYGAAV
jgi:hypothetical protein